MKITRWRPFPKSGVWKNVTAHIFSYKSNFYFMKIAQKIYPNSIFLIPNLDFSAFEWYNKYIK